ncbi:MAG: TRAP transporter permease [Synergistetes bacterium]|nr:TRAP transporter permease [Synergistota bacterium]
MNNTLNKVTETTVTFISVAMVIFHLYTTLFGLFPALIQRSIHLGFALSLCFILKRAFVKNKLRIIPWYDIILVFLGLLSSGYVVLIYKDVVEDPLLWVGMLDKVLAIVAVILILEASRRAVGCTFLVMVLIFVAYAYWGPYFPGIWAHQGFSFDVILQILYHSSNGIWGMLLDISSTMLAIFAIFGATLTSIGVGDTFLKVAEAISGGRVGGPAKVAVVASALFGMISGSAVANVATTGVFTIPAMKKVGFKPSFAGAVEAVASTGGQIMPPILGAGAFIMSEIIGIPYLKIAVAALIPALLYFSSAFLTVHFEALKFGILGDERAALEREKVFKSVRILFLFVPIFVFLYFLMRGYTPSIGGVYAIFSTLVLFLIFIRPPLLGESGLLNIFKRICLEAGNTILEIAVLLASAQIVVSLIAMTGFGVKISDIIVSLGEGNLFLTLILSALVSIILGMGLPTTAAYVLGASVLGPALINLGLHPLVAHLFIFYFSILSTITPPVCAAVFLGAGLAEANWLETGINAVRMALPAFIVPFAFVYSPTLLLVGPWPKVFLSVVTSLLGVFLLSLAVVGYFKWTLPLWSRFVLALGGIMMIVPGYISDLLGFVIGILTLFLVKPKDKGFFINKGGV